MGFDSKDFAAWKFKWLDALMTGSEGRELRVALYLLQRCSAETGRINPSMQNVAHMLSCSPKTVERAIERLVLMGVLARVRYSRHDSYHYRFLDEWMQSMIGVRNRLRVEWDAKRLDQQTEALGPDNTVGSDR